MKAIQRNFLIPAAHSKVTANQTVWLRVVLRKGGGSYGNVASQMLATYVYGLLVLRGNTDP